jgi:DNA repair protein RadC
MTTLYIRDKAGEYRPAPPKAVINESIRLAKAKVKGRTLTSPGLAIEFLTAILAHLEHEVFGCLFLDNQHRVLCFEEMFRGTISSAHIYPREVVKQALAANAAAVIFAHNHPSGITEPSEADKQITQKLKMALDMVEIRVLDHFILGEGDGYSFAEHGLM